RSVTKNHLESRMRGNVHVRFGVGVKVRFLGLHHVKVEPRSNNAIAAGITSFSRREDLQCDRSQSERGKQDRARKQTHHQKMDLARHPEKAQPTTKKMRAKDRPLANDFVTDGEFDRLLAAWFGNIARVLVPGGGFYIWGGYANCANY